MKVRDIMTTDVRACRPEDTLDVAARLMWDHDCGCLPVLGLDDRVQAMITDRDICMGAWSQGRSLHELHVSDTMSPRVITCRPEDDLAEAAARMEKSEVRRLPVVDEAGRLRGLLALNDLARSAKAGCEKDLHDEPAAQALGVLSAVCRHRAARKEAERKSVVPAVQPKAALPAVKAEPPKPAAKAMPKTASQPAPKPMAKTASQPARKAKPAAKNKPPRAPGTSGGKAARA